MTSYDQAGELSLCSYASISFFRFDDLKEALSISVEALSKMGSHLESNINI